MLPEEIPFLSVAELSGYIKKKEITPVETVRAYLERIERIDPKLNAYITVLADQAEHDAELAGREIASGNYLGPLHGIPVAIKDQIHSKGVRTTDASKIRTDFVPVEDATVLSKLKAAGAILLGKLNMSEFALGDPISSAFGPAHNPWDLERNPGTSSTGSGAATAGFLCATSLGEDTGGSIRGPAANCGLVGLRPTWGRVSRYGVDGACWSIDTIGPISRCVADCAITIGAIAGFDAKDKYTHQVPVPNYYENLGNDLTPLKIGVVKELMDTDTMGTNPEVVSAINTAIEIFAGLGAQIKEISLPLAKHTGAIVRTITHTERVSIHPEWLRERPQDFHHNTRVAFMAGNLIPAQVYYKAQKLRALVRHQVLEAFKDVDLLIQPTSSGPANVMNLEPGVESLEQAKKALVEGGFRGLYSLSGAPALSIPCGFTSPGDGALPLAMQIAGRHFEENTVLRAAYVYEQATTWHNRRPPIS